MASADYFNNLRLLTETETMRQQIHSRAHFQCAFSFYLLDSHLQPKALIRLFAEHKMAVSEAVST